MTKPEGGLCKQLQYNADGAAMCIVFTLHALFTIS